MRPLGLWTRKMIGCLKQDLMDHPNRSSAESNGEKMCELWEPSLEIPEGKNSSSGPEIIIVTFGKECDWFLLLS